MLDTHDEHSSFNPANQEQIEPETFESNNLCDCLDYAKDTKDFELIENAITLQNTIIEKAVSELNTLIFEAQIVRNLPLVNRLQKIKVLLTSNLKK